MVYKNIVLTDPENEDYFYDEAIKTLRTNIQFSGKNYKTILLTSSYSSEGKSD
ncbi:MAG: tyrosine protein kinase, partial [Lachnospiraceae bacterium]|nr:tyrosine protein kinase [Lachnospiraceae bacterium]